MRIAWVTRSFLDYRIPVFEELDRLVGGDLYLFHSQAVPDHVREAAARALGVRARALGGEWALGPEDTAFFANRNLSIRYQPGLHREIRAVQPDVLIGDGFFKWTASLLSYRARHGTPLVVLYERTAHTERSAQWFRTLFRKWVVRRVDAMGCNGSLSKEYSKTLGMDPGRITVGHMAADTAGLKTAVDQARAEPSLTVTEPARMDSPVFLFVGQMIARKGCHELLDAWAEHERAPGTGSLLMLGDGPLGEAIEKQIADAGLERAHLVGKIDHSEIPAYYAAADVLVMPTLEDNWSLVVPEAMASGLPILCSKWNGCWPELVRPDENGFVFDPLDPSSLSGALAWAVDRSEHLADLGRRSREIIREHSPRAAARSIFAAAEIARRHRGVE